MSDGIFHPKPGEVTVFERDRVLTREAVERFKSEWNAATDGRAVFLCAGTRVVRSQSGWWARIVAWLRWRPA